jgi:uncharacterized membrane protein
LELLVGVTGVDGQASDVVGAAATSSKVRSSGWLSQLRKFGTSLSLGTQIIWLLSVVISAVSLLFVVKVLFAPSFGLKRADLHFNFFQPGLISFHAAMGVIALLIGPLQMSPFLRTAHPHLHRYFGRIYISIVFVVAGTSMFLVPKTELLGMTFAMPVSAAVCLACITLGVVSIRRHDAAAHRRWMFRAYAAFSISISLRLYLQILRTISDGPSEYKYAISFWLAVLTNLIVVEVVLRRPSMRMPNNLAGNAPR